jgi:hypothetical protein
MKSGAPNLGHKVTAYRALQYIKKNGPAISTGLFDALGFSFESFLSTANWSDEKTEKWESGISAKLKEVLAIPYAIREKKDQRKSIETIEHSLRMTGVIDEDWSLEIVPIDKDTYYIEVLCGTDYLFAI